MIYRCPNPKCDVLWTRVRQTKKVFPNRVRHRLCPDCFKWEVWVNSK